MKNILLLCLLLTSCRTLSMANFDIIRTVRYCESNGFKAELKRTDLGQVWDVICVPKDSDKEKQP